MDDGGRAGAAGSSIALQRVQFGGLRKKGRQKRGMDGSNGAGREEFDHFREWLSSRSLLRSHLNSDLCQQLIPPETMCTASVKRSGVAAV